MTSKELAKIAGVSQATVSLCLNDSPHVSEATKKRVKALAKEYRFVQNSHAQNLRSSKSDAIAMIFPEHFVDFLENPYFNFLYNRIRQKLAPLGLELLVVYNNDRKSSLEHVDSLLRSKRIDGLISCRTDLYAETLAYMKDNGIPCVYLLTDENATNIAPSVITDNAYGAALVANRFWELGCKRMMTIGINIATTASAVRTAAFCKALAERNVRLSADDILMLERTSFAAGRLLALDNIEALAAHDAVFVQSDVAAIGVMQGLREKGIRIPQDIRLFGYDNNPYCGEWVYPRLSTVSSVDETTAERVCEFLCDGLRGENIDERSYVYLPQLIIRETCE